MYGLSLDWERCALGVEAVERQPPRQGAGLLGEWGGLSDGPRKPWWEYRYRSSRPEDLQKRRHDISKLSDLVVVRFVNAGREGEPDQVRRDKMAGFLGDLGFPIAAGKWSGGVSEGEVRAYQDRALQLLQSAGSGSTIYAVQSVNEALSAHDLHFMLPMVTLPHPPDAPTPAQARHNPLLGLDVEHTPLVVVPALDYPPGSKAPRLALTPRSLFDFMAMECAMVAVNGAVLVTCQRCGDFYLTGPKTGKLRAKRGRFCSDRCRVASARLHRAEEAARAARGRGRGRPPGKTKKAQSARRKA